MEAALSVYLEAFATTLGSREQLAIAEAADALLVIPKTLAVNAAKDATELARPSLIRKPKPVGLGPNENARDAVHLEQHAWYCLHASRALRCIGDRRLSDASSTKEDI